MCGCSRIHRVKLERPFCGGGYSRARFTCRETSAEHVHRSRHASMQTSATTKKSAAIRSPAAECFCTRGQWEFVGSTLVRPTRFEPRFGMAQSDWCLVVNMHLLYASHPSMWKHLSVELYFGAHSCYYQRSCVSNVIKPGEYTSLLEELVRCCPTYKLVRIPFHAVEDQSCVLRSLADKALDFPNLTRIRYTRLSSELCCLCFLTRCAWSSWTTRPVPSSATSRGRSARATSSPCSSGSARLAV